MDVSLYQAAAAMNATERWQEMISDNLAAGSVPGARKSEISFSAIQAGLASGAAGLRGPGYVIPTATTATNFQQGELRSSGNPMDFALEGPGFFTVQMPNGQTAYTRDGEFQLNSQDQLVTKQGYLVLGTAGPIQFDPNSSAAVTISATGDVSQGADKKGTLQLTDFNNPSLLTPLGGSLFSADSPALQKTVAATTHVRQGFLEGANGSPTSQMGSLITAMRMFEANQKVLQMQSDRMSREITDLGNPT
ncbi:MAG TPA: flagellar hook-basal body protein [Candidatus Sulfopaludibacter sp.]|nr:flagellar hook-basal body protein [Candidatus Sulfopaludibacter sp.]